MYAGFWKRLFANILDTIVIYVVLIIAVILGVLLRALLSQLITHMELYSWVVVYQILDVITYFLYASIAWLYCAIMESSKLQATVGKLALGIIVVDQRYEKISFLRASGRYWSRILSLLTFYIGFIMAGFTKKKQALHDKVAKTYVVDKKIMGLTNQSMPIDTSSSSFGISEVMTN